jgi:hypothetical protein
MAESETSICNKALGALGANTIISLTDKTPEGRLCNEHYAACRDAVLEDVPWTFAKQTFKIGSPITDIETGSPLAKIELVGWNNAFAIPPDMLRVTSVNDQEDEWEIEGRLVYTNAGSIVLKGIMRVIDPSFFSPRFVQCLVFYLAANIVLPLTESPSRMETMMQRYMHEKLRAQSNDGRQGKNVRRFTTLRR